MSEKDRILDENLRQLMQTSLGDEILPSPQAGEKVWRVLQAEAKHLYGQQDFPPLCLVLLGGCVLLGSIWLFLGGMPVQTQPELQAMAFLFALIPASNLFLLPAAAFLIIKRRGKNVKNIS